MDEAGTNIIYWEGVTAAKYGCPRRASSNLPTTTDPILDAIETFRAALADYSENAPDEELAANAYAASTYRMPLLTIERWTKPAITARGALEAMRLARDAEVDGDYAIVGPMISAALAYYEATG